MFVFYLFGDHRVLPVLTPTSPAWRSSELVEQAQHLQLVGEPPRLRGRRPRAAGPWRDRLFAAQAVRAHLSPPSPLPHHRGRGRDSDAQGGGLSVRLSRAAPGDAGEDLKHYRRMDQAEFYRFRTRSEEHTSELQSLMRISYAVFCLKKKTQNVQKHNSPI